MDVKELMALSEKATVGKWSACGAERGGCICGLIWSEEADAALACTSVKDTPDGPDVIIGNQIGANAVLIAAVVNFIRSPEFAEMVKNDARWKYARSNLTQGCQQRTITPWVICFRADAFVEGWTLDQLDGLVDNAIAAHLAGQGEGNG